ncbi:MAG: metallophosphoesterase [Gemmatimonadaceae bacterium]
MSSRRVAAIYDIHGNLPALEAVLEEIQAAGVDHVVVGGDVLPGPMPRECLAVLEQVNIPASFIQGNGDRAVVAQRSGSESVTIPEQYRGMMRWVAGELDDKLAAWIATWPMTTTVELDFLGKVFFCHATPRSDTEMFSAETSEEKLLPIFEGVSESIVVCGHTHKQFDRMIGKTRVINAGSVGMPFGATGAYWLLLDTDIELRRTDYDLARAAERIALTDYPEAQEFAQNFVLKKTDLAD